MELNLKDKVVVITGAGQGIGKAVAEAFGKEGCKLAICDISQENLDKVSHPLSDEELLAVAGGRKDCNGWGN